MKRKKIVILPKLNDAGGDLSKKWFIYYSVRDPRTDKMNVLRIMSVYPIRMNRYGVNVLTKLFRNLLLN